MKKLVRFNIIVVLLFNLIACGGGSDGGGDDGGASTNTTASVNAGIDQSVNELLGTTVAAVGFPGGGNFAWRQIAGPLLTEFPSVESSVTWTAPAGKTEQVIGLTVEYTSPNGDIVSDTVEITVLPVNLDPVAIATLKTPVTDPVAPDTTVILNAASSFDQDADGVISSYAWVQGEGTPMVSQLNGSSSVEFHFVAPQVTTVTLFPFKLTVTDDEGGTAEYDISVNVDPGLSVVSVAAGADRVVNEQQAVSLTAVGDPVGGNYKWTQLSGDSLSGFPMTGSAIEFTTLATKSLKTYEFRVEYESPTGFVAYDQLKVIVNPVNMQPSAVIRVLTPALLPAGPNEVVTLDGTASTDADGVIVSYEWLQMSGSVNIAPEPSSDPGVFVFRTPVQSNPESYLYRLIVVDDELGQGSFDMEIEVNGTTDLIVADAGGDQLADEFSTVSLDGQNSFSSVSAVTCSWRLLAGPTVSFTNPDNCLSTFVAPNVDVDTDLIFEVKVTNSTGDQATDATTVTVKPVSLGKITDSGQTLCYNQNQQIPCDDSNYPRQDADFGRDSVAAFLDKVGTGEAGFDYTKLGANGDELADDASDYFCIRDNFTGLIWEIKTVSVDGVPNTALRDNKNTYSWHYPDGSTGGESGTAADPQTICPSTGDCGLETFVEEVNDSVYCGGANWRVPTMLELQSIVNYSKGVADGAVDSSLFQDLPDLGLQGHQYFWSGETSADGGGEHSAWVINFASGNDNTLPKAAAAYVRLVRQE